MINNPTILKDFEVVGFFISEKCVKIIAHILIWHSIRYKININYFIFVFAKTKEGVRKRWEALLIE